MCRRDRERGTTESAYCNLMRVQGILRCCFCGLLSLRRIADKNPIESPFECECDENAEPLRIKCMGHIDAVKYINTHLSRAPLFSRLLFYSIRSSDASIRDFRCDAADLICVLCVRLRARARDGNGVPNATK